MPESDQTGGSSPGSPGSPVDVATGNLTKSFELNTPQTTAVSVAASAAKKVYEEPPIPPSKKEPKDPLEKPKKIYDHPFLSEYSLTLRVQRLEERIRELRKWKWEVAYREATIGDALTEEECRKRISNHKAELIGDLEKWKNGTVFRLRRLQEAQENKYAIEFAQLAADKVEINKGIDMMKKWLMELEFAR